MLGKAFIGILAIFLLLGAFASPINNGIKNWRTVDPTEDFVVTTGAGITTANVTLASELFQSAVSEVIEITSNITGEEPVASSYSGDKLLVSSLNPGATRALSVNYYAYSESEVMRAIGPFLSFLIIGGLLAAIAIGIFWGGKRR